MKWIPDNIPLAVAWRLLLLIAAVVVILAIGMRQYDWRPFGEKVMPEAGDAVDLVIQKEMDLPIDAEMTPDADATPEEITPEDATPEDETSPTPAATVTPAPTPPPATPTPTPTPTPKPKAPKTMDDEGLEDFLEDQLDE